jgi:NAD(P)-dependent dehydrogenase (short-subunit alcohol dehydrogenase family)
MNIQTYNALVIGAHGTIGSAFVQALNADATCTQVYQLSRHTHEGFSLESEASIEQAAAQFKVFAPFDLIIDATGALIIDGVGPEKHLGALNTEHLLRSYQINAVGPAMLIKHFSPLLASPRCVYAKLSARVGSISDNQKGGWYGYRASKAALNMLLQTAAIEMQRRRPQAIVVALQPGTVASPLSAPFAGGHASIAADESAVGMLAAIKQLQVKPGAQFYDYRGEMIAW